MHRQDAASLDDALDGRLTQADLAAVRERPWSPWSYHSSRRLPSLKFQSRVELTRRAVQQRLTTRNTLRSVQQRLTIATFSQPIPSTQYP